MLPKRLHSADDETEEATNRGAAGSCEEGARGSCRGVDSCQIPNTAAIVLATAGAPEPGASLAAIGRSDRIPITQVRSNRPLRLLPLLWTLQPQQSLHSQPGGNAEHPPLPTYVSSSLPVEATALLTHAPMRKALTPAATALRYTALRCAAVRWKALCCAALHCTCNAQCSALAVVAVVYAHCTRAQAALWGRLVMRKRWWSTRPPR